MNRGHRWLSLWLSLGAVSGCASKASSPAASFTGGELELLFSGQVGDQAFACGKAYDDIGSSGVTAMAQDLRFYVSDVRLIRQDGEEVSVPFADRAPWQTQEVALLDFEDGTGPCEASGNASTNDRITLTAPEGKYVGVLLSIAVPAELNHEDPSQAPAPLQVSAMQWNWLLGYKFLRAEMMPLHDAEAAAHHGMGGMGGTGNPGSSAAPGEATSHGRDSQFHLGSLGCANTTTSPAGTCARPNRNELRFERFNPESQLIVADLAQMMKGIDLLASNHCHGMPAASCTPFYASVGLDYETGEQHHKQSAFRVEARPKD